VRARVAGLELEPGCLVVAHRGGYAPAAPWLDTADGQMAHAASAIWPVPGIVPE
jgi:hypothetical protein